MNPRTGYPTLRSLWAIAMSLLFLSCLKPGSNSNWTANACCQYLFNPANRRLAWDVQKGL
jgi:hypothetical protein